MKQPFIERVKSWLCKVLGHKLKYSHNFDNMNHYNCKRCGRIISKNKFYGMWRKSDDKSERYKELLIAIYEIIHAKKEDDVDHYDAIHQLIDDWYESEIIK